MPCACYAAPQTRFIRFFIGLWMGEERFPCKPHILNPLSRPPSPPQVKLVLVGRKGQQYFKRRPQYDIVKTFSLGAAPTTKDAQALSDEIFAEFVSDEVQKVELVYTKFVSLISSDPIIQTMLPLAPSGAVCDINGNCVDAADDEIFKLTTRVRRRLAMLLLDRAENVQLLLLCRDADPRCVVYSVLVRIVPMCQQACIGAYSATFRLDRLYAALDLSRSGISLSP